MFNGGFAVARAIWKAVVRFGPVGVPVKLYSVEKDVRLHTHLLHDEDRERLQQRMVCSQEQVAVGRGETVKGYEVDEDRYVVVDPDELDALEPEGSREVEVTEFVDADDVDPRYLDRTYFLGPDNDDQMYVNLARSLEQAGLAGMCRWVMRSKAYLGVLQHRGGLLSLTTHHYADAVVPQESLDFKRVEPSQREKTVARNLVEELTEHFQPEKYRDEYEARLRNLIEQKAQGKEVRLPKPKKPEPTREENLVDVLERSLTALRK